VLYRVERVAVTFAGRTVLRDVTLQHNPGEKLILLGRNGSGKTTLLRVIDGGQEASAGTVTRARGLEIATVEQLRGAGSTTTVIDACLDAIPGLVALEAELEALSSHGHGAGEADAARLHELHEAYERLDGYRARARVETALDAIGLPRSLHGRPLGQLSGGERTRVALVRALLSPASLLLLDEPTNHLDLLGVEFLARELAARETAVLLVTHDRELVDRVGGEILELHGGRLERYPAGYARYRREREARRAHARKAWQLQQAEIARQEEFIRRNIAGQNTRQAQARQKLLDRIERLEAPESDLAPVAMSWPATGRSGTRVLEAERLSVGWQAPLLEQVSLTLRRGERMAVVGRNGAGKSTLLRTLAGRSAPLGGRLALGTGVVPGWYDQDQAEVPDAASVLDALLEARPDWAPADARAWAGRFGFSGERAEAGTTTLSGGERARLALARLIALGPNLMLLDEPTNHLDLPTCEVLEDALAGFPGALVLVSHDRRLVERGATEVLLLEGGRAELVGRVEEAFARIGLAASPRAAERERPAGPRRSEREEERRRLRRDAARARERSDALAGELDQADRRVRELEVRQCEPDVFADPLRARETALEVEAARQRADELLEAWAEAEETAVALERRLAAIEPAR
jgi:ATP-binding cassette subfamily F protein 3